MTSNFDFKGRLIGDYKITESLGSGGMAVIYKALDTRSGKLVAVKFLRPAISNLELAVQRFEQEAKALTRLSHPDIVQLIDYGHHEGWPYLVMEYLSGGTLKQKTGKPISWQRSSELLAPIARALNYAHKNGITHRDVKPSNILLGQDDHARLSDFGVAKLTGGDETTVDLTGTGFGVGTPDYMAPEQFDGNSEVGVDIYAFGVVFYELITGRKPYTSATPSGLILKKHTESPLTPSQLVRDLPPEVEIFLLKILQIDPKKRYKSMEEVSSIVTRFSDGTFHDSLLVNRKKIGQWSWQATLALLIPVFAIISWLTISNLFVKSDSDQASQVELVETSNVDSSTANSQDAIGMTIAVTQTHYLFQDEFSDLASGWDSGSTTEFLTDYQDGGYRILVNEIEKIAWSTPGLNFPGDVRVEVYATKRGGPDNNAFGLLCRHSRTEDGFRFYFFYITSEGGAAIGKYINNKPVYLSSTTNPIPEINSGAATNRINIDCVGENLILYANGSPILGATDATLKEGDVGLIARTFKETGTDILFDNFSVAVP
jgi:serine/threonine protein kinase